MLVMHSDRLLSVGAIARLNDLTKNIILRRGPRILKDLINISKYEFDVLLYPSRLQVQLYHDFMNLFLYSARGGMGESQVGVFVLVDALTMLLAHPCAARSHYAKAQSDNADSSPMIRTVCHVHACLSCTGTVAVGAV